MTAGSSTTEHKRALRAEALAGVLACVGIAMLASANMLGIVLLAVAGAAHAGISITYSQHRSALKKAEAEAGAAMRVAELSTPKQRVV